MKLHGAEKFPSIWVSRELNTPAKDPTKEKSSKLTILPPAMCRGSWWPRGSWGRSRCRGCTAPRLSCPACSGVFIMIHSRWWWLVVFLLFGDNNGPSSFIRIFTHLGYFDACAVCIADWVERLRVSVVAGMHIFSFFSLWFYHSDERTLKREKRSCG